MKSVVLIVGAGPGLSSAIARRFAGDGASVALAARTVEKLDSIAQATGARAFVCDATSVDAVGGLFDEVTRTLGEPNVVIYNAGVRIRGPVVDLDPKGVERTISMRDHGRRCGPRLARRGESVRADAVGTGQRA